MGIQNMRNMNQLSYSRSISNEKLKVATSKTLKHIQSQLSQSAKNYRKGTVLFNGTQSNTIIFILKGKVKVGYYDPQFKLVSRFVLYDNDAFGLSQLRRPENKTRVVETLTQVKVAEIHIDRVRKWMEQSTDFAGFVMDQICKQCNFLEKRLNDMVYFNSNKRIVEFLVDLVKERGRRMGYEHVVFDFFIHQDIADLTGTARQTVTVTLNDLRRAGIIEFNRKRLLVKDLKKLQQAAK